ncbi:MAG: HD domain-containing protein [Armatimonas sp.]
MDATIDALLDSWRTALGADHEAYRNHVYRVFNFAVAVAKATGEGREKLAIAAAFHDIGIWLDGTFDYLEPSELRATEYLTELGRPGWNDTVHEIIDQHHRIRPWRGRDSDLVEPFRKADWLDVCLFALPSPLERSYLAAVLQRFPRCGFHRRLVAFALDRARTHPLSPIPVLKW